LLTQQSVLVRLPEYSGRVVQVDGEWAAIAQESEANPANVVCGENLAYVIYTSGSTGKPKGSLLTHQGTCNLVHAQAQVYNRATNRHVLQFSSFSFDASLYEMVMALLSGATLFMGTRDVLQPGPQLTEALRKYQISSLTITPSALAVLSSNECATLKTIIVAGAACYVDLMTRCAHGRDYYKAHGPTNTT